MRRPVVAFAVLGAAAVAASLLWGGSRDAGQQERPLRHEASAIVKLVPVRVLGTDGRPVMDLRKEDFVLYEDGQKKTITEFEVHTITEAGLTVTPELPAAVKPAAAMSRKFFLFLDVQRSDPEGRQKAVAVAERFLDTQVRPGDEVGLLGFYSMSGFFVREYLTTDVGRVRRALKAVTEAPPSAGEWHTVGGGDLVRPEGHVPAGGADIPFAGMAVFVPGTAAFGRVDFIPRLKEVAEIFKTIPGNKSLVLFSSRSIGPEIGKLFGATGTAIYAINTQDWMLLPTGDKVKHIWWDHPLKDLAAASGGKYFADINQVTTIAEDLQTLSGNFYVLGYYVKESWEGRYHHIRVEVARPDTRVLVQDGYADAKPFTQMTDFEKDVQLLDLIWSDEPTSHPLPVAIDPLVPAAVPAAGTAAQACLLARLEVGAKTGPPAARSEIVVLLRDKTGAVILSRRWAFDFGRYDGKIVFPYLMTPVQAGTYEARLVLRDLGTGEACAGRAVFDVAPAPKEGVVLFSPLLLEAGAEAVFLKLSVPSKEKSGRMERTLLDFYPLVPKGYHPVVSEVFAGTERLILILPFELRPARPEDRPILSVEAKLISRATGVETPLELTVRDHTTHEGSPDILAAEILLSAIVPGAYDIEIRVEDAETERSSSVRKQLVIR